MAKHRTNGCRRIRAAVLVQMSGRGQLGRDLAQRSLTALRTLAAQLADQGNHFALAFGVALATLDLLTSQGALAVSCTLELGHDHRFVELGDGPEDLANELRRWRVVQEGAWAVSGHQLDAERLQLGKPNLLHHQIASKPIGRLDDDGPRAIAGKMGKHGREARSGLDVVGTADRGIVELADELETGALGERLDSRALALIAVLVGADIGGRRGADIGDSLSR